MNSTAMPTGASSFGAHPPAMARTINSSAIGDNNVFFIVPVFLSHLKLIVCRLLRRYVCIIEPGVSGQQQALKILFSRNTAVAIALGELTEVILTVI